MIPQFFAHYPVGKFQTRPTLQGLNPAIAVLILVPLRYIHYANGDEELYHIKKDPYEWEDLAMNPEYTSKLEEYRKHTPVSFTPLLEPSAQFLPPLSWVPFTGKNPSASKPDGKKMRLVFMNRQKPPVSPQWVTREGELIPTRQTFW